MNKKNVAVIFGSRSVEHDVSIVTAILSVIKPLKLSEKYQPIPIYISKHGLWHTGDEFADIKTYQSGKIDSLLNSNQPIDLQIGNGLYLVKSGLRTKYTKIDVAFPATHGTFGEDGSLMGLLRMCQVPYVGCDMQSSVIAMDKILSKQVVMSANLPTNKWHWFDRREFANHPTAVLKKSSQLQFPLFVKPAHLGSSIGINKVHDKDELLNALEIAFHLDHRVIVEEAVNNLIEVTLPIIGNEVPTPATLEEPALKDDKFFDFQAKYLNQGKGTKTPGSKSSQGYSHLPARLDKELYDQAVQIATKCYEAIGCSGIARIDLLIDAKTKAIYFNEVNPLPGSLYSHNFKHSGISPLELTEKLIDLAIEKHQSDNQSNLTFDTNYLKQF